MANKPEIKHVYKVTGTVFVEANNVRHAAHVAKGTFQMKENGPAIFVVEERQVSFGSPYCVDLNLPGHADRVFDEDAKTKIGGTF